jgi:hypothetical protein
MRVQGETSTASSCAMFWKSERMGRRIAAAPSWNELLGSFLSGFDD